MKIAHGICICSPRPCDVLRSLGNADDAPGRKDFRSEKYAYRKGESSKKEGPAMGMLAPHAFREVVAELLVVHVDGVVKERTLAEDYREMDHI